MRWTHQTRVEKGGESSKGGIPCEGTAPELRLSETPGLLGGTQSRDKKGWVSGTAVAQSIQARSFQEKKKKSKTKNNKKPEGAKVLGRYRC